MRGCLEVTPESILTPGRFPMFIRTCSAKDRSSKGIYDVDAFESALASQLPDNLILSHDLIEGCYARAAAGQ
jgi:hypothetical protein